MAALNGKQWFFAALLGAGAAALAITLVQRRRRELAQALEDDERVSEASEASFPASDPPSYTPTLGPKLVR